MGLFKFIDSIGIKIDQLTNKMESTIDKFGEYLDNTIGKKFIVNPGRISSELSQQRRMIGQQSDKDVKNLMNEKSQPDSVLQYTDSDFDSEFTQSLEYLGIQLPGNNTQ